MDNTNDRDEPDGFTLAHIPIAVARQTLTTLLDAAEDTKRSQIGRIPNEYLKGRYDGLSAAADLVERLIAVAEENPLRVSIEELFASVKRRTTGDVGR
jgi:hypothetical protein